MSSEPANSLLQTKSCLCLSSEACNQAGPWMIWLTIMHCARSGPFKVARIALKRTSPAPNVCTQDGQLYQQPEAAALVASRVKEVTASVPYLIKIGHVPDKSQAQELVKAILPYASGIVMTNSVASSVSDQEGKPMFGGRTARYLWKGNKRGFSQTAQNFLHS